MKASGHCCFHKDLAWKSPSLSCVMYKIETKNERGDFVLIATGHHAVMDRSSEPKAEATQEHRNGTLISI